MAAHAPDARDGRPSSGNGDNLEGGATQISPVQAFNADLHFLGEPVWGNAFIKGNLIIQKLALLAHANKMVITGNNITANSLVLQDWKSQERVSLTSHQSVASSDQSGDKNFTELLKYESGEELSVHARNAHRHVDEFSNMVIYHGDLSITSEVFRSLKYTYHKRGANRPNTPHVSRR